MVAWRRNVRMLSVPACYRFQKTESPSQRTSIPSLTSLLHLRQSMPKYIYPKWSLTPSNRTILRDMPQKSPPTAKKTLPSEATPQLSVQLEVITFSIPTARTATTKATSYVIRPPHSVKGVRDALEEATIYFKIGTAHSSVSKESSYLTTTLSGITNYTVSEAMS